MIMQLRRQCDRPGVWGARANGLDSELRQRNICKKAQSWMIHRKGCRGLLNADQESIPPRTSTPSAVNVLNQCAVRFRAENISLPPDPDVIHT